MCILMGYVGTVAEVHKAVVEACLLGDVLWMVPFVRLVRLSLALDHLYPSHILVRGSYLVGPKRATRNWKYVISDKL